MTRARGGVALALGCGLFGALLYAPATSSGRLADDWVLLRTVRRVSGLGWPFTHNDLGQPPGSGHFYRPVWVLWNRAVYDVSHSPAFAHIVNLVLFGIVCAEVALLVRRLAGDRAAAIAGVSVAVFPSHGESVAWISGNTDVLAVALALAAILLALTARPSLRRDVAIAAFTALAALSKEIAMVLPVLMAILLWVTGAGSPELRRWRWWRPALVMFATVALILIPRTLVIGGVGGYGGQAVTPVRAAGALASFVLGGFSAPQLPLLQDPVLLLVPTLVLGLLAAGLYRAWRGRSAVSERLALAGGAWILLSLILVLNQPLNLNTRNGDRLLLLPSVGLAIAGGALLARVRRPAALAGWGVVAAACAASCVLSALDWRTAGAESRRLLAEIDRLAPPHGHLVALSLPTDYRAAHLYPDALDLAVRESGRPDVSLTGCMPVQVLSLRPRQVSFVPLPLGLWFGRATRRAPFEVPVLGSSAPAPSAACQFGQAPDQPSETLGTALRALVLPGPAVASAAIPIYFDGRDMRPAL
ncbi:MAG TPA: hypothetical protein VG388_08650 [Solirubrobacteraceae bacterium]|jgi:hypothetical protein|nr:hypothetical protein [Solirubrobacteraceae bacterium]